MGSNWLRVAKDSDEQAGVLQRQQELEQLTASIAEIEERVETLDESLSDCRQSLRDLEGQLEPIHKPSAVTTDSLAANFERKANAEDKSAAV